MKTGLILLLIGVPAFGQLTINGNGGGGTSPVARSFQDSDFKITVTGQVLPIVTGSSMTTGTVGGRVFAISTAQKTTDNLQLGAALSGAYQPGLSGTVRWTSLNPSIATIDGSGYATQVASSGSCTFLCKTTNPVYTTPYSYLFTTQGGAVTTVFDHWTSVSGTLPLPYYMNSAVDQLMATSGTSGLPGSLKMFNYIDNSYGVSGSYTRNTTVWTGSVDLSGIAVWNSEDENGSDPQNPDDSFTTQSRGGTLITPTDVICADHFPLDAGTPSNPLTIRFVDNSNTVYVANVTASVWVPSTDIRIAHLQWQGSTPTTLAVYPVLPANYATYWPDHIPNFFPVLCVNQNLRIFVNDSLGNNGLNQINAFQTEYYSLSDGRAPFYCMSFIHNQSTESNRVPFSMSVRTGDSGDPVFCLINNQLVVLGCNTFVGSGPSAADYISAINTALATAGSSYTVSTPAGMSSFPTY